MQVHTESIDLGVEVVVALNLFFEVVELPSHSPDTLH
jgi:hypothetical protein